MVLDVISGQWRYAAGTLDAEPNGVRATVAEAKSAADAFAHPGCDGEGCSPWLGDGRADGLT